MPSSRIPNLLHTLFFLTLTVFSFLLAQALLLAFTHGQHVAATLANQRLQLIAEVLTYLFTLGLAFFAFPIFWQQPFLAGIRWNPESVSWRLPILGLALGFAAQATEIFLPHPKDAPIEQLFRNPALIWFLALFGVVLGPLFEEFAFRGFLLPAIANAVDYLRIPRDPDPLVSLERLIAWRSSSTFSALALTVSTVITSLLFALLHAPQLGYTWPAVALLATVSAVLCLVRIRTGSVAASALVHGCYNLSIFVTLFLSTSGFRHLDRV